MGWKAGKQLWKVEDRVYRDSRAILRCQELVSALLVLEWVVHSFNLLAAKRNFKDESINQSINQNDPTLFS